VTFTPIIHQSYLKVRKACNDYEQLATDGLSMKVAELASSEIVWGNNFRLQLPFLALASSIIYLCTPEPALTERYNSALEREFLPSAYPMDRMFKSLSLTKG
jgi:hypothetical protein